MKKAKYPVIREELAKRGQTLKDLEDVLHIDRTNIGLRIRGKRDWTIGEVKDLCRYFNKDFWDLFEEEEENGKENI